MKPLMTAFPRWAVGGDVGGRGVTSIIQQTLILFLLFDERGRWLHGLTKSGVLNIGSFYRQLCLLQRLLGLEYHPTNNQKAFSEIAETYPEA
jgi:hypothetical protein